MDARLEREVKLRFDDPVTARAAVVAAGGTPLRSRRLQDDCLLDTAEGALRDRRAALRVRLEAGRTVLTFKGPAEPSLMKVREEIETDVGDRPGLLRLLERLGYVVWFRYQKYREEFTLRAAVVAVDETPLGTFVEVEGTDRSVTDAVRALGRGTRDFENASYPELYVRHCTSRGLPVADMVFERE